MTKGEVVALVAEVRLACDQSARGRAAHSAEKLRRVALRAAEALEFTSIEAVALRFACRDLREQRDEALEGLASGASGQAVSDR